jgi:vitamin B12/bleomycin/antimicrobial peptide transport system ATP-binding/permease protein
MLSLGEQQRLIFACLLLNKPKYAILDEATSALDPQNEKHLYQQLKDSGTTFLSVGHRKSLSNYHEVRGSLIVTRRGLSDHSILDLTTDRTWSLKASEASPNLTSNNLLKGDVKVA